MDNFNLSPKLLLNQMFEASVDTAIAVIDAEFQLVYINTTAEKYFNCASKQVVGKSVLDLHIHNKRSSEKFYQAVSKIKKGEIFEYRIELQRDTGPHYLGMRLSGLWQDKQLIGYLLLATDISRRHHNECELKSQQLYFRSLYEKAPSPYHSLDADGVIRHVNQAWLDCFGYDKESIIGHLMYELIEESKRAGFIQEFKQFKKDGEIHGKRFPLLHASGRILTVTVEGVAILDETGNFHHSNCILTDITAQNLLEEKLKRSESRYKNLFKSIRDSLIIFEPENLQIEEINPVTEALFGYDRKQLLNMQISELFAHPEAIKTSLKQMMRQNQLELRMEQQQIRCRDLSLRSVEFSTVRIEIDAQERLLGNFRDISERLRTEQALSESELRYSTIFSSAAACIATANASGKLLSVNSTFCDFLGYTEQELLKLSFQELTHPDDLQSSTQFFEIKEQPPVQGRLLEKRYIRKDGTVVWGLLSNSWIFDNANEPKYAIGLILDITELKQAEKDKEQMQRELQQASKMDALGQLTGGVAHDFNNILATILGFSDLIQRHLSTSDESGKLAAYLSEIHIAGQRGKQLVEQMLRFSRSEPGKPEFLSLSPVVKEAVKLLISTMPSSLEIELDIDTDVPAILIDPVQVHQTLFNLCLNARDELKGKGKIHIGLYHLHDFSFECSSCHAAAAGDWVELAVSDNGHGIPETLHDKIFEPFYTTKQKSSGTGLGLSVVNSILHRQQAHIKLESQIGRGSCFRLFFSIPEVPLQLETETHTAGSCTVPPLSKSLNILLVDDDDSVLRALNDYLQLMGFLTTAFNDSQRALDYFAKYPERFDLVLTDQTMPGMTGVELVKQIHFLNAQIPVILMTGWSDAVNQETASNFGIGKYLQKPVNNEELLKQILEML